MKNPSCQPAVTGFAGGVCAAADAAPSATSAAAVAPRKPRRRRGFTTLLPRNESYKSKGPEATGASGPWYVSVKELRFDRYPINNTTIERAGAAPLFG